MYIPENIKTIIGKRAACVDNVGRSDSTIFIYDDMVLKIEKQSEESDNEHRIMEWLDGRMPVPKVLGCEKHKGLSYLLMSRADGLMSCDDYYMKRPELLVRLLSEGLRLLWNEEAAQCPNIITLDYRLKTAQYNVEKGLVDVDDVQPETFGERGFKNPERLLQWLMDNKPEEELVLSHGDFCLPNIFLKEHRVSGFIDLGKMGIADKYQDIALCYRSLKRNLAGAYEGSVRGEIDDKLLFDNLGIVPDYEKIRYYILLDELF